MRETSTDYRRPYRPRAIAIANRIGARAPLPRFDLERLLEAARKRTGLSDFGDPSFREPLAVLLSSIEEEARLHPVGRLITRERLLGVLANRLRVSLALARDRRIERTPLEGPIVITGLQRTGTTLLHRVLASDPRLRWLASWEALHPAPIEGRDRRQENARRAEKALAYLAPDFFAIHPVEALAPEEDVLLLDYAFRSTVPESTLRVPSYARWLEAQDQRPAYRYMATLLRVLGSQAGAGKRWLLKTPHHLEWLDVLFEVLPGTRVIWTHRDPTVTVGSFCSMIAHGRGVFSDEIDPHEIGRDWGRKIARLIDRAMDTRERAAGGTFHDVRYEALVRDPMSEVRRIYRFLDMELPREVEREMQRTLDASPQHRHGRHVYALEDFGLREGELRERFRAYRERFDLTGSQRAAG
jgi:hypothetical protein